MRGARFPNARVRRTTASVMLKVAAICSGLRPVLISLAKVSQQVTSSGGNRPRFSISEASMAAASSPGARMAMGTGSISIPSAMAAMAAYQRRAPATISKWPGATAPSWTFSSTSMVSRTPRWRIDGPMSAVSGSGRPWFILSGEMVMLRGSAKASFITVAPVFRGGTDAARDAVQGAGGVEDAPGLAQGLRRRK